MENRKQSFRSVVGESVRVRSLCINYTIEKVWESRSTREANEAVLNLFRTFNNASHTQLPHIFSNYNIYYLRAAPNFHIRIFEANNLLVRIFVTHHHSAPAISKQPTQIHLCVRVERNHIRHCFTIAVMCVHLTSRYAIDERIVADDVLVRRIHIGGIHIPLFSFDLLAAHPFALAFRSDGTQAVFFCYRRLENQWMVARLPIDENGTKLNAELKWSIRWRFRDFWTFVSRAKDFYRQF